MKPGLASGVLVCLMIALTGCDWRTWMFFSPDLDSAQQETRQIQFPILDTPNIITALRFPNRPGIRVLKLDIIQPSGTLYQTIWRAFSTDRDAPATINHPDIAGETLQVESVTANRGLVRLYVGIPIAGTDITRFRISGVFPVEARLNGEGAGHAVKSHFELVL